MKTLKILVVLGLLINLCLGCRDKSFEKIQKQLFEPTPDLLHQKISLFEGGIKELSLQKELNPNKGFLVDFIDIGCPDCYGKLEYFNNSSLIRKNFNAIVIFSGSVESYSIFDVFKKYKNISFYYDEFHQIVFSNGLRDLNYSTIVLDKESKLQLYGNVESEVMLKFIKKLVQ